MKCSLFFNCCTHDILFLFEHLEFCNCVCKTICFSLLTNKEQVLERLIKRFLNSFRLDLHYLHDYRNNSGGERRCSLFLFFCQMSVSLLSSGGFCSKSCIYKTNTRVHYVTRSLLSLWTNNKIDKSLSIAHTSKGFWHNAWISNNDV